MKRLLSTKIKFRIAHCPKCKGKGTYLFKAGYDSKGLRCGCGDCYDWKVALRGVLELEKEVRKLKRESK